MSRGGAPPREDGQALVLMLGVLVAVILGAVVLGGVAHGLLTRGGAQGTADLAALAGARALGDAHPRVFAPALIGGRPNPEHLTRAAYLDVGRRAALRTAQRNGARDVRVGFPGERGELAPLRVRVEVRDPIPAGSEEVPSTSVAEAELVLGAADVVSASAGAGEYRGPFAVRQGKRMRPDVALGFDRLAAAARAAGHHLLITSAFRSDAEQAVLFAARPDPKWVARPGTSLHRLGTELDLGRRRPYGWLAANAAGSTSSSATPGAVALRLDAERVVVDPTFGGDEGVGRRHRAGAGGATAGAACRARSERFAPMIARAAQRWNVSGVLLAAQLHQESGFNPNAVSRAGAQGIAQFMPATRAATGCRTDGPRGEHRRPGPPHARPPAPLRRGAARPRRLQRRTGAGRALRLYPAVPRDPALRRDHPRPHARRRLRRRAGVGLTVRLVR
jgi:hypothetical protein